jgi:hypothetical protein
VRLATRESGFTALAILAALAVTGAACASRRFVLPAGPGTPRPDFAALFDEATAGCRTVRTMTAELAVSGRAAGQAIRRGRVQAGFVAPDAVYLLAPAPFGQPAFVLAAQGARGTLLLPRDRVVVTDAPVRAMLDALMGVDRGPASLRALVTGCVVPEPRPQAGRALAGGWVAVDLQGGAVAWLRRQDDRWRVSVAQDAGLLVEYSDYPAGAAATPRALRIRSSPAGSAGAPGTAFTDLRARLSRVEVNVPLDPGTFTVVVPEGTEPITVDELRGWAPLAR